MKGILQKLNLGLPQEVAQLGYPPSDVLKLTATGAAVINVKNGLVILAGAGATLATLALPTAGAQSAGGDDGKVLWIITGTAQAHTVTTPATGINGGSTTLTFQAAIGNGIVLIAFNGTWLAAAYANDTTPNVVIS